MSQRHLIRLAELAIYAIVILSLVGLAAFMVHLDRMGEAFGAVVGAITLIIQAIGRVGQAQAMQAMADHLAQSAPIQKGDD